MYINEVFDVAYSSLPDDIKYALMNLFADNITVESNTDEKVTALVDFVDTLANSSISEYSFNEIIDKAFSSMDEAFINEVSDEYIKRAANKALEQRKKAYSDATKGAIGLSAFNKAENNPINKKGETLSSRIDTAKNYQPKARDYSSYKQSAPKESSSKEGAVGKLKNAVGKVKQWGKNQNLWKSPDYSELRGAIGKTYGEKGKEAWTNKTDYKGNKEKTPEVKAEAPVKTTKAKAEAPVEKAEEVKVKTPKSKRTNAVKNVEAKVETQVPEVKTKKAKINKKTETPKAEEVKVKTPKIEDNVIKNAKKEVVKNLNNKPSTRTKTSKKTETPEVKTEKTKTIKGTKTSKAEEVKVETPKAEEVKTEKPSSTISTLTNDSKKSNSVYIKPGQLETANTGRRAGKSSDSIEQMIKKGEEDAAKRKSKVGLSGTGIARNQDASRRADQERLLNNYKDRRIEMTKRPGYSEKEVKDLDNKIANLQKQLGLVGAHESISDAIVLLTKTNISESAFVEVMELLAPSISNIKKVEAREQEKLNKALQDIGDQSLSHRVNPETVKAAEKAGKRLETFREYAKKRFG